MNIKSIISRPQKLVKRKLVIALLVLLLPLLACLSVLYVRVDARAKIDAARPADAIIVLGCAVWPGERPSPALYARIQHAVALYRAGYASHLILSGGLGTYPPTEAEAMRRVAAQAGVPAEALVLEEQSHSTEDNLANSGAIMQARGWKNAIVVSDPFHMYRAELIAHDLGMEVYGSGAMDSPMYTDLGLRARSTARESIALVWYYGTRVLGEPAWLYGLLKGRV